MPAFGHTAVTVPGTKTGPARTVQFWLRAGGFAITFHPRNGYVAVPGTKPWGK